jgi:translation elongation factor EF-Ts
MDVSTAQIKELRDKSGAGVMECRTALMETQGDFDKALDNLKKQAVSKIQKKSQRTANQGVVACYLHTGGRIGSMVELNCETDFVARTIRCLRKVNWHKKLPVYSSSLILRVRNSPFRMSLTKLSPRSEKTSR